MQFACEDDSIVKRIRTIVVAVRTIYSVVRQGTVGGGHTLTRLTDGDVVNIQVEHIGAVEVADGHITHATVGTQVNGVFVPVALGTAATATLNGFAIGFANALSTHRPFLNHCEGARVGVGRGNG